MGHTLSDDFVGRVHGDGGDFSLAGTPYDGALAAAWLSGLPLDPAAALKAAGWTLRSVVNRAGIAERICGGDTEGKCTFSPNDPNNDDVHFWVATT